ncbi:MAG: hypothetical protein E7163_01410 [Firmicutes bacterium]|nr:hypothetical protein [Bacillota bacterium]
MKRFLKLILFILLFFICLNSTKALTGNIKIEEQIPNIRINIKTASNNEIFNMYKLIYEKENELAYSLKPYDNINTKSYTIYTDVEKIDINLANEEWIYLKYLMFYGYKFKDRTDIKWYIATQFIIWEYLLEENEEIYFVDANNNSINLYTDEIKTIKEDVEKMYIMPSFLNKTYDTNNPDYVLKLNQELVLEDKNKVLDLYNPIICNKNINYEIVDNKLKLSFDTAGNYLIKFQKKDGESLKLPKIFYDKDNSLICRGFISMPIGYTYVNVKNPNLKIVNASEVKTDFSLSGNKFGIYKENGTLYKHLIIGTNNSATINEIPPGKYYLKQISSTYGYQINKEKVPFEINSADLELKVVSSLATKRVNIEKYIKDVNGKIKNENNATFKIYNTSNNKLVGTISTDEYGKTNIDLVYGTYKIVHKDGTKGYNLADDTLITIDDKYNEYESIIVESNQITGNLKLINIDKNTKELIKKDSYFKLYDTLTNSYYSINNDITFKTYNGVLELNNIPYGKYKIEQIIPPTGYKNTNNTISLYINKDKEESELEFKNDVITSDLKVTFKDKETNEIIKDEVAIKILNTYTNNFYSYKDNDIFESKNGVIKIYNIPYGNYKIIEIKSSTNYEVLNTDLFFSVTKVDEQIELNIEKKHLTGNLIINALDIESNSTLKDILVGLYDSNKNLINELYTDENGLVMINNLNTGTYYVKVLSTLDNYQLNKNEYEVIVSNKIDSEVNIYNEMKKGSVKILKVDYLTSEYLANIKIGIYDKNKELIKEVYTDNDGKLEIDNINVGKYFIKELLSENKELTGTEITLEVKDNIKSTITLIDRTKIEVPKTGVNEFLIGFIFSIFILLVGIFICNED